MRCAAESLVTLRKTWNAALIKEDFIIFKQITEQKCCFKSKILLLSWQIYHFFFILLVFVLTLNFRKGRKSRKVLLIKRTPKEIQIFYSEVPLWKGQTSTFIPENICSFTPRFFSQTNNIKTADFKSSYPLQKDLIAILCLW